MKKVITIVFVSMMMLAFTQCGNSNNNSNQGEIKGTKEYRELCLETNGWNEWILPKDYFDVVKSNLWFEPIEIHDARFDVLVERLKKCIICRNVKQ